ncbi:MAG: arylamine N-acetyltransferase, partial [Polyangiaceae bacterium]
LLVGHHFTSTHPQSRFRRELIVARSTPGGSVVIRGRRLRVREGGASHDEGLDDRTALAVALRKHFGIDVPGIEALRVPAVPEWE